MARLSVRYVIDNMDGDKWISEAWAQKVLFRLVKTPAYLRDFGPGRTFTKVEKAYGTDNVLGKNEETTIDLDEGRYYTATGKEWWAANGRHAKSWFINDTYVNMRCSLHLKEEEPIDDFLKEVEKSYLEGGAEYEENTVEELTINGRRVLLKKRYEPLEFYQSKDYMVDSHIYKGKYTMLFEMGEVGVLHTEASEQRKKSKKLGAAAAIAGSVAGYPGAMGLVATGRSFYSRFAEVKAVKAARKQNLIRVSGGFVRNKIYAAPEQFDFVWEYIVSHCPKGKIYE